MEPHEINVWLGIDVGKTEHWATAVDIDGNQLRSSTLPNDEAKLRQLYTDLSKHGQVLVVVDQPATIGALAVAVAQAMNIAVAYLPGLSMRRIADLYPGNAKTDQRDAYIIAQAARTMPHTLRTLRPLDEDEAELGMLTGFDEDLAKQITQNRNRIPRSVHPDSSRSRTRPWTTPRTSRDSGPHSDMANTPHAEKSR